MFFEFCIYPINSNFRNGYYIMYACKYVLNLIMFCKQKTAYEMISYEIEARAYERVPLTDEEWALINKE